MNRTFSQIKAIETGKRSMTDKGLEEGEMNR